MAWFFEISSSKNMLREVLIMQMMHHDDDRAVLRTGSISCAYQLNKAKLMKLWGF